MRELDGPGGVESERLPQLGDRFRSRVLSEEHHGGVAGHEAEERGHDDSDGDEREEEEENPVRDIAKHP
jgi:hypothetical protein